MAEDESREFLDILKSNVGFDRPELWLEIAKRKGFKRVAANFLSSCPYCGGSVGRSLGSFIYYSTRCHLRHCQKCLLYFSDARVADELLEQHFEETYKCETYFLQRRSHIFQEGAELVDRLTPHRGAVLDVGGATGFQLSRIQQLRPDLTLQLNDLSEQACAKARELGIRAYCGSLPSVCNELEEVDTAILSDVMYYEPNLGALLRTLRSKVKIGGYLIIRGPNKLPLIKLGCLVQLFSRTPLRLWFFNPEHLYLLTTRFLDKALSEHGFEIIEVQNSPLLLSESGPNTCRKIYFSLAERIRKVVCHYFVVTPSTIIIARRAQLKEECPSINRS